MCYKRFAYRMQTTLPDVLVRCRIVAGIFAINSRNAETNRFAAEIPSHAGSETPGISCRSLAPFRGFVLPLSNARPKRRTYHTIRAEDRLAINVESIFKGQL